MFRKRQKKPSLKSQIIAIAIIVLAAVCIPAILQYRSVWNLAFNRVEDNRPVEPFAAAPWGANPRQVAKAYGQPDYKSTYYYRTKGVDYNHRLIFGQPAKIIYRFDHNRLEAVICWIHLTDAVPVNAGEWAARCEEAILAHMPQAERFKVESSYPSEVYYMDADTIAHCTVWYQLIQIREEDEPRYNPMITVFLTHRARHPELEAQLLQYRTQNKLSETETNP